MNNITTLESAEAEKRKATLARKLQELFNTSREREDLQIEYLADPLIRSDPALTATSPFISSTTEHMASMRSKPRLPRSRIRLTVFVSGARSRFPPGGSTRPLGPSVSRLSVRRRSAWQWNGV